MEILYRIFESSNSLIDFLNERKYQNSRAHKMSKKSEYSMRYGDELIVKAMKGDIKTYGIHDKIKPDFYGMMPIVPKALVSDPYCFLNQKKIREENKYITLIFDVSVPWNYSAEQMIENGKKLIAVMKYMEQTGFRIRLFACASSASSPYAPSNCNALLLKLKDFNQPFSVNRIAFPIANPNFLRDVSFEWEDKDPVCVYHDSYGYALGYSITTKEASIAFSNFLGKGSLFITHFMVAMNDFQKKLMSDSETILKFGYEGL